MRQWVKRCAPIYSNIDMQTSLIAGNSRNGQSAAILIYNYQSSSTTIPSGSTSKASVDGNEKNPNKDCDIV